MLCFVSDDLEVITPDWLMEMVSRAMRAEVGAVGAKIYDTVGRIDSAGVVVGEHGEARYPHRGLAVRRDTSVARYVLKNFRQWMVGAC
jgi:hypothetical protein